jgi:hypothetical protein
MTLSGSRLDADHFQPADVLFGYVPDNAPSTSPFAELPSAMSIRRAHSEQITYMRKRNVLA